jgi:hypothetical protein
MLTAYIHTHIHTYIHTYIHAYIHETKDAHIKISVHYLLESPMDVLGSRGRIKQMVLLATDGINTA